MSRQKTTFLMVMVCTIASFQVYSQNPKRYESVVERALEVAEHKDAESPVIFTGSSEIEAWTDLSEVFPTTEVLDHGFEGSHTSDLIYFANELMLSHNPSKIFIHEGDNDLANGKSVDIVLADMKTLFHVIRRRLPDTPIYVISPRPSPARLDLRPKYEELNYLLFLLCLEKDVTFINVWDYMLDEYGDVKNDLYIEDGLHMNEDGYKIWAQAIASQLN